MTPSVIARMQIEQSHHIDASEPDADGNFEYHYEYDLYHFRDGPTRLSARSYVDEPGQAHFLGIEHHGRPRQLRDTDLAHPLFVAAAAFLRGQGKTRLQWLSGRGNGYETVPDEP